MTAVSPYELPVPVERRSGRRPRILAIGDAVAPTGFARVIRSVLGPLADRYDITQLATNYDGDPHDWPWSLFPAEPGGGDDRGAIRLPSLLAHVRPDLVFIVNDLWLAGRYAEIVREQGLTELPVVAYCPIEADGIDLGALSRLREATKLVLYTRFARDGVERAIDEADDRLSYPPSFTDVRPHGVDTTMFHPLGEPGYPSTRLAAKRQLLGPDTDPDTFIVLNANRNQPRKRIDVTMRAFADFARDKPATVKLHLHMGLRDLGWNLSELSRRFGISDRLILSTETAGMPELSPEELNLVYNAADVGLNTASGEGWGLPSFEHAATGAPQILPAFGNLVEIWEGAAMQIPARLVLTTPGLLFDEHLVCPGDVAAALEQLFADSALRTDLGRRAMARAHDPAFHWDRIAETWGELFEDLLRESRSTAIP